MSSRVRNNAAQARYRDRNKLFADFRSGDLIKITLNKEYSSICKLRPITKNDKDKFTYRDKFDYKSTRADNLYTIFNDGQIGLYVGRYDGAAVLLINEGLYSCAVACIKKVEMNNG
jgi:hypothetical protein